MKKIPPKPKVIPSQKPRVVHANNHVKEILYISSAVVGLVCTIDAYFYSGKDLNYQRHKQLEIVQELSKTDHKMLDLIKEVNIKVDNNVKSIESLERRLDTMETRLNRLETKIDNLHTSTK